MLKKQLEAALESGKLNHLLKDVRQRGNGRGRGPGNNDGRGKVINMVRENTNNRKRKTWNTHTEAWMNAPITFPPMPSDEVSNDPLIIEANRIRYRRPQQENDDEVHSSKGRIPLQYHPRCTGMRDLRAVSSTIHAMVKFPTPRGIATLIARTAPKVTIETQFSPDYRLQLINLLKNNMDVFEWEPSDMVGVPKRIAKHTLNVNPSITPVVHKRRMLGSEKSQAVLKEVQEWLKADIIRPVKYPTWISNPVLVKKVDDTWRMCIDFKNLNFACPKDFYPLPKIDLKIEAVMGFPFKCFLDAYKGYHQIQMNEEDEEKTAFYTDQGTYYYTKIPFGLKNAGATYQRVVDSARDDNKTRSPIPIGDGDGDVNRFLDGDGDGDGDEVEKRGWGWLFLAFASFMGFIVYQMDVKSAFLYGTIDEEVYVSQPPGFVDPDHPKKVYKVVKALYGLHQAPRAWYATLSTFLEKHGYKRGTIDKTLFIKKDKKDIMLVQVYVDDILFGSTRKSWCDEFEALMNGKFQMSSMGELIFFLGLQVKQSQTGLFIS
ncbi:reverse transcriptase domain-containing protein [Tanacetum coccineum]